MTKPKRKRRRETERATDDVEVLYVENLPSVDIPEILRVELPQDNSVVITEVSEAAAPTEVRIRIESSACSYNVLSLLCL